jgi:ankyrin repeat protein
LEAAHAQELLGIELFQLCIHNKWPEVRKYLSSDAAEEEKKSNIMCRNDKGSTCLHLACCHDAPDDIIKAMLDIGGKELVMMTGSYWTVLHTACMNGASYNMIKMLIDVGGKDLVMAKNDYDYTALRCLCVTIKTHTKVAEKIKLFLQVGDANLLLSSHAGKTPLEIVTAEGASKKIKKLLTLQSTTPVADIWLKTMKGYDLFLLCLHKEWPEVRKYLSSDAAEEEKRSNIMYRDDHDGMTCLHAAFAQAAPNPDDIIKAMIDIGGKELVTMTDNGDRTVLHFASYNGASYNIIKMLIEVGGKDLFMAKKANGNTELHCLCIAITTHTKVAEKIKLFLQVGDANLLLSAKNGSGRTPLEIATDNGASKKVKKLLTVQSTTPVADMQMEAEHAQELLGKFVEIFQNAPDDAKRRDIFLRAVSLTGTDVSKNNDNPFDIGDQSKIILDLPHFSKYNWFEKVNNCIGARNATKLFTANLSSHPLLRSCNSGDTDAVEKLVLKAEVGSKECTRLLEGRDNPFRCTVLLLMARAENGMGNGNTVNIVRLLLQYGARPDARDICGNNVLHYLAKVSAGLVMRQSIRLSNDVLLTLFVPLFFQSVDSSDSILIADDCINAARCSRYFGMKVMVNGTTHNNINSQVGTLQGYVHDQKCAETGRFAVVMDNDNRTLSLKPGNIFVMKSNRKVGGCIYDQSRKLFNEPNRLGEICIQDSLMNFSTKQGINFALHMMDVHNIDLSGPQFLGDSAQQMIAASIADHPDETFRTKVEEYLAWKDHEATLFCVNCGEIYGEYRCVRCQKVCYCSESCHIAHYGVHKKHCISGTEDEVVIQEFPFEASLVERCWFEEIFWLKVTSEKSNLIFKDRNASIRLSIDQMVFSSYRDFLKEASRGGTHVKATFRKNPKPKIIVFPKTKHKRAW